jgi:muramidase (phage lysozyme)
MFEQYVNNSSVRAVLDVIAYCEGTGSDYNIIYSGRRFSGYAGHPHQTICAGKYCSDAAGRYQFLGATWEGLRRQYGFADFSPVNQDLGAIALISQKGALSNVLSGDLAGAVQKIKGVWPSLPGGSQQTRNWTQVSSFYAQRAGGAQQLNVLGSGFPAFTLPDLSGGETEQGGKYLLWLMVGLVLVRVIRG